MYGNNQFTSVYRGGCFLHSIVIDGEDGSLFPSLELREQNLGVGPLVGHEEDTLQTWKDTTKSNK